MSEQTVILNSLDRLDKVDADALQADVYTYIAEALGGILGQAEGCLSPFSVAFSAVGPNLYATFSAFAFSAKVPDLTRLGEVTGSAMRATWKAHIVNFNPAVEPGEVVEYTAVKTAADAAFAVYSGNANTDRVGVAVSGYEGWNRLLAESAVPSLWARLYTNPEDTDTRRRWDVGLVDEAPYAAPRRNVQRVEFAWDVFRPAPGAGNPWSLVGRIVGWRSAAGVLTTPVIRPAYAWDNPAHYAPGLFGPGTTEDPRGDSNRLGLDAGAVPLSGTTVDGLIPDAGDLALVRQLYLLRRVVDAIKGAGASEGVPPGGDAWYNRPSRSLAGLATDLTAAQANITDLNLVSPLAVMRLSLSTAIATYSVTAQVRGAPSRSGTMVQAADHRAALTSATLAALGMTPAEANTILLSGRVQATIAINGLAVDLYNTELQVFKDNSTYGATPRWDVKALFRDSAGALTSPGATGWAATLGYSSYYITLVFF
jgi:hypothetical protein